MYERNNTPPGEATARTQEAIDINDFVFAATGARVRMLIKRGCVRQVGSEGDGVPVYVLP